MEHKIIFLLILFLPIISATPTLELQNEEIQPGETILATIFTQGEFTAQIEKSQIKFFEGRKQTSLETGIFFYNSTHYIYIYTNKASNLTLKIENILYKESDTLSSITLEKNLTIKENILKNEETNETYTQILKVKPGFVFTSQAPTIKLTNTGNSTINLTFNEEDISIPSLITQELSFIPEETFSLAKISAYKDFLIPTIYLKANENTTFISPSISPDLRAEKESISLELFTENKTQETIQIFNFGDQNLTNIKIFHNTSFLEASNLENMQPREVQNLTLDLSPKIPGHFQDSIKITYTQQEKEHSLEIPLSIFVIPKGSPVEKFEVKEETSCAELSGKVCEEGSFCSGNATFTKNSEYCCFDSCIQENSKETESSGFGWLIALVIFAILGFTGYHFYKKQRQLKPQTPKDSLAETTKKFESRLAGNKSNRITGGLTKS